MKPIRPLLLATAAALLVAGLGGCSHSEPADEPAANSVDVSEVPPPRNEPVAEVTPPPALPANIVAADANATATVDAPPERATPPDEQMLDDASATGMTARASRDQPADAAPTNAE